MNDMTKAGIDLVVLDVVRKLKNDLAYCAPEMVPAMCLRRVQEAVDRAVTKVLGDTRLMRVEALTRPSEAPAGLFEDEDTPVRSGGLML